ncbi:NIPSNAP family protein [Paenibacillus sp. GCM10023250]|uniref:NIPSNAP family protein n=1 Tax=Paenibacillus sp. GCM10023250 TaxID=3252648 RepID=UPI00360C4470
MMLYELRIYDVMPGKMPALLDRFRDSAIGLFEKHGMTITQFWQDADEARNRLYYVVEHPDMEARNANYERFRSDPEWLEVRRASELGGPLIQKQESLFMHQAAFFRRQS